MAPLLLKANRKISFINPNPERDVFRLSPVDNSKVRRVRKWSARCSPTLGKFIFGFIPIDFSLVASPIPDNSSICGEPNAPAHKITSRFARIICLLPPISISTPLTVCASSAKHKANTCAADSCVKFCRFFTTGAMNA